MNNRAFSKIWIIVIFVVFLVGGISAWQYWMPKEEVRISEEVTKTETTQWGEYILEKITEDFQSADFTDRRLIGVKDDDQRDIIIPSVKELMGWEKTPGETGFYPVEVSFPPYSTKIFFVKYQAGTGHSSGFFMLDVNTLESKRLIKAGSIYENYYNYVSRVSPDGLRIASLGGENLYLLDLINDRVELLAGAGPGEVFYPAKEVPDFAWLNNYTIQYPVYSADRIYDPPVEIRQISIKEIEEVVEDETANWKTYRNQEYRFEIKYPEDWFLSELGFYTYFTPKKPELEKIGARFDILRREVRPEDEIRCKNNETFLGTAEIQDLITNKCAFQDFGDVAQNDWRVSIIRDSTYLSFICKKYQMVEEKCEQILSTFRFLE